MIMSSLPSYNNSHFLLFATESLVHLFKLFEQHSKFNHPKKFLKMLQNVSVQPTICSSSVLAFKLLTRFMTSTERNWNLSIKNLNKRTTNYSYYFRNVKGNLNLFATSIIEQCRPPVPVTSLGIILTLTLTLETNNAREYQFSADISSEKDWPKVEKRLTRNLRGQDLPM